MHEALGCGADELQSLVYVYVSCVEVFVTGNKVALPSQDFLHVDDVLVFLIEDKTHPGYF